MLNTAASCCNSSSGSGASEPRATVCRDTVVSAPASAPTEIQPAILSLWLMGRKTSSRDNTLYTWEQAQTAGSARGSGRAGAHVQKNRRMPSKTDAGGGGQPLPWLATAAAARAAACASP